MDSAEDATVCGQGEDTRARYAIFSECPHCGSDMSPEHAHYRCTACGWRDSCCD